MRFIDRLRSGAVFDIEAELEDSIRRWHESSGDVPLHEWLGLSWKAYSLLVENPSTRHPRSASSPPATVAPSPAVTHGLLVELSADDPVAMTSKALLEGLRGLSGSGVRVTGIEALDAELFVVASFLRLKLKAGPLAAQLGLGLHSPAEDGALTREERQAVVDRLEAFKRDMLDSTD